MAAEGLLDKTDEMAPNLDGAPNDAFGNSGVYILDAVGSGRYKIGWSNDVRSRSESIKTGCPFPVKVLNVIDSDRAGEIWLHRRFDAYRVCGEWFCLPDHVVRFLSSIQSEITVVNGES